MLTADDRDAPGVPPVARHDTALDSLEDGQLLALVRTGHDTAYAVLFSRYSYAARRLARHLGGRDESEDVVAETFTRILDQLRRGAGPDTAFRSYLFTSVRHEVTRRRRAAQRVVPTGTDAEIDTEVPFGDGRLDAFERTAVRAAYESLPQRWREALWHLDVEGRKPHDLAELLGVSPNSVSALVYRARSGLRQAYLEQHVRHDGLAGDTCAAVVGKLSAVVRGVATVRVNEMVLPHLERCRSCMDTYLELREVGLQVGSSGAGPAADHTPVAGVVPC